MEKNAMKTILALVLGLTLISTAALASTLPMMSDPVCTGAKPASKLVWVPRTNSCDRNGDGANDCIGMNPYKCSLHCRGLEAVDLDLNMRRPVDLGNGTCARENLAGTLLWKGAVGDGLDRPGDAYRDPRQPLPTGVLLFGFFRAQGFYVDTRVDYCDSALGDLTRCAAERDKLAEQVATLQRNQGTARPLQPLPPNVTPGGSGASGTSSAIPAFPVTIARNRSVPPTPDDFSRLERLTLQHAERLSELYAVIRHCKAGERVIIDRQLTPRCEAIAGTLGVSERSKVPAPPLYSGKLKALELQIEELQVALLLAVAIALLSIVSTLYLFLRDHRGIARLQDRNDTLEADIIREKEATAAARAALRRASREHEERLAVVQRLGQEVQTLEMARCRHDMTQYVLRPVYDELVVAKNKFQTDLGELRQAFTDQSGAVARTEADLAAKEEAFAAEQAARAQAEATLRDVRGDLEVARRELQETSSLPSLVPSTSVVSPDLERRLRELAAQFSDDTFAAIEQFLANPKIKHRRRAVTALDALKGARTRILSPGGLATASG